MDPDIYEIGRDIAFVAYKEGISRTVMIVGTATDPVADDWEVAQVVSFMNNTQNNFAITLLESARRRWSKKFKTAMMEYKLRRT